MRAALSLVLVLCCTSGCREASAPEPARTPSVDAGASVYSPFVLQMSTELPFQRISMKDVGMSIAPRQRNEVYEHVAMSLSTALAADAELPMSSEVLYSAEDADPASHLACGYQRVYVDLWQPQGQERWGFSLWSGCSEEDEFAHREVQRQGPDDVDALTRSIAHALRKAVQTRCFTQSC